MINENQEPGAEAALDFTNCPHWGAGGRYIYDPATKTRTRVEPADEASNDQVQSETPAKPAGKANKTNVKESDNG